MTDPFSSDGAKTPPKPFTIEEGHRKVRSFVLRQGRFTPAQQRAFDELWPRFGLDFRPIEAGGAPRDFAAAFGRAAPVVVEIGFDKTFVEYVQPARLHGKSIMITDGQGRKAMVTAANLKARNGVVHVVDGVFLPR